MTKTGVFDDPTGGSPEPGDKVDFTFSVANTGDVRLSDVAIDDAKVTAVVCPTATLEVGQTMTCTATYTITGVDVAANKVENTATASGVAPVIPPDTTGVKVVSSPSSVTVTLDAKAPVAPVVKPSNGSTVSGTAEPGPTVTVVDGSGTLCAR